MNMNESWLIFDKHSPTVWSEFCECSIAIYVVILFLSTLDSECGMLLFWFKMLVLCDIQREWMSYVSPENTNAPSSAE